MAFAVGPSFNSASNRTLPAVISIFFGIGYLLHIYQSKST
jgi:hypothetical protein